MNRAILSAAVSCALIFGIAKAQPAAPALSNALLRQAPGLDSRALNTGLAALDALKASGAKVRSGVLAIIDYSRPSTERRLWVFDLAHQRLLFNEWVAHGRNSGGNLATHFSNAPDSLMTSLGVYLTGQPYMGHHGLSLRLIGLDRGLNDNALSREIVIHSAAYVNGTIAQRLGRMGRSWGCPAVRPEISSQLIRAIQGGAVLLAYYPTLGTSDQVASAALGR